MEKPAEIQSEHAVNNDTLQKVEASDIPEDLGGNVSDIPKGYWKSYRFIGSILGIYFMSTSLYLGYVLPASILTVINADLGPSDNYLLISTAFTLTSGVALLMVGRLSDIIGRRYFLLGGQTIGLVGALVCATAESVNVLIGGTVLVGLSAAAQLTFTFVVQELVPNRHRALTQAVMVCANFAFAGLGPVIARLLVENTKLGWRWCYYFNTISCGVSVILLGTCYFPPNFRQLHTTMTKMQELQELDYIGLAIYAASMVLILLGFSWGGSAYPWKSAHVIAALVVGWVMLVAFVLYEGYAPLKQPLVPMRLFRNRNYVAIVIVGTIGQMVYFSLNILWPQLVESLYTTDNITIGWISCTTGSALLLGELLIAPFFAKLGHQNWQLVASAVGLTAFLGGLSAATQYNRPLALTMSILASMFTGWLELITLVANGLVVPPSELGLANGVFGSARQVGGSIAASIYVAIFSSRISKNLPADVTSAVVGAGLSPANLPALFQAIGNGTSEAIEAIPGINTEIMVALGTATKEAYASSFKIVFLSSISFGGIAIIAACFTKDISHLLNDYVARTLGAPQERQEKAVTDEMTKSRSVEIV